MNDVRSSWTFDRAAALRRLDDDDALLTEVIEQFLADTPAALSAIERAIQTGDGTALGEAAHGLKGAAGYLAADDLCVAAQELEGFGRAGQTGDARIAWPRFETLFNDVVVGLRAALVSRP